MIFGFGLAVRPRSRRKAAESLHPNQQRIVETEIEHPQTAGHAVHHDCGPFELLAQASLDPGSGRIVAASQRPQVATVDAVIDSFHARTPLSHPSTLDPQPR